MAHRGISRRREDAGQGLLPLPLDASAYAMQSDTVGRIREVLLAADRPDFLPGQLSLIAAMDEGVRFTVYATPELDEGVFREAAAKAGLGDRRINVVQSDRWVTGWLRNSATVLSSPHGPTLACEKPASAGLPEHLMGVDGRFLRLEGGSSMPLPMGGDILSSADAAYVNYSTTTPEQRKAAFGMAGGRLLCVGESLSPEERLRAAEYLGDLDMWLTPGIPRPAGGRLRDRVVHLADPRAASEAVEALGRGGRSQLEGWVRRLCEVRGQMEESDRMLQPWWIRRENEKLAVVLDKVALELAGRGLEVARVPHLSLMEGRFHLTYCCGLCESYELPDMRRVDNRYMPEYGIGWLDDMAEKAYSDCGYSVRRVNGLESLLELGGSLRCVTLVMNRGPFMEGRGRVQHQ